MKLVKLGGQVVDFARNGNAVDIHKNLPKPLIRFKPDWRQTEVTGARELDYYHSERALGYMFRNIGLPDLDKPIEGIPTEYPKATGPLKDPISRILAPLVWCTLNLDTDADIAEPEMESEIDHAEQLHAQYVREMQFICVTHTLGDAPGVPLKEEEVVLGTILTNYIRPRSCAEREYRMRLHAEGLVNDIRRQIIQSEETATENQLRSGLLRAWEVWAWAQHHRDREFIESFSLIALGLIVEYLDRLGGLRPELILPDISTHSETPVLVGPRSSCIVQ
jgi:RNA-dependent RNA polymerase